MIILDVRVSDIQPRPRAGQWIRSSIPLLTFVTLGLPAGALGVAWPYMRASFGAPLAGTSSWRAGFAAMGGAFLAVGLLVSARRQDWAEAAVPPAGNPSQNAPGRPAYRRAMVVLAGLFLVAAGLEATAGDWSYTQLTVGRALSD